MSDTREIVRKVDQAERVLRALAVFAAVVITAALLATLWFTYSTQRNVLALVEEQRLEEGERALEDAKRREESAARLKGALAEVQAINNTHDETVQQRLEDVVRRVALLLDRPAGVPVDPVTARGIPGANPPPPPGPSGPPTSPTTTSTGSPPRPSASTTVAPSPATTTPAPGCDKQDKAKKC